MGKKGIGRLENSVLGGNTDYAHHCTHTQNTQLRVAFGRLGVTVSLYTTLSRRILGQTQKQHHWCVKKNAAIPTAESCFGNQQKHFFVTDKAS